MHAIETRDLTRRFGSRLAVHELTFSVPAGSIVGMLGPNGAGKTTTVRMLAALVRPTAGSAWIAGHELGVENDRIRGSVGILTESPGLYGSLTAVENLDLYAQLHGLSAPQARRRIGELLELLGLADRRNDLAGTFSKGMRQKVALARALLHDPPVLFLDEPTSGLDPESAHTVREFIKGLRREGRAILLATHNLAEADQLCDEIVLLRTRLLRQDTPANLRAEMKGAGVLIEIAAEARPYLEPLGSDSRFSPSVVDRHHLRVQLPDRDRDTPDLIRLLISCGAPIVSVVHETRSLEDVYLELMSENPPVSGRSPGGPVSIEATSHH